MKEVKRFGDLGFKFEDVSEWVAFKDLIGREIVVLDYLLANGDFGQYAIIKFTEEENGEVKATTTGGKVVIDKLNKAKERNLLPLIGKVVRKKNWYDLV